MFQIITLPESSPEKTHTNKQNEKVETQGYGIVAFYSENHTVRWQRVGVFFSPCPPVANFVPSGWMSTEKMGLPKKQNTSNNTSFIQLKC